MRPKTLLWFSFFLFGKNPLTRGPFSAVRDAAIKSRVASPTGPHARAHLESRVANHHARHPEWIDRFQCKYRIWSGVITCFRYQSQRSDDRKGWIVEDLD